jgi:hypothetical protein
MAAKLKSIITLAILAIQRLTGRVGTSGLYAGPVTTKEKE